MRHNDLKTIIPAVFLCTAVWAPQSVLSENRTIGATDASIMSIDRQVKPGAKVTLKVSAPAGAQCSIEAQDASFLEMAALRPKKANKEGTVSWSWKIPKKYQAQAMPVIVTVDRNGRQEKLLTEVSVIGQSGPDLNITSAAKQARLGERVTVSAQTVAGAKCKIEVQGAAFPDSANLADHTADPNGKVSWTFHVPDRYKADKLPVIVTSEAAGSQSKAFTAIDVARFTAGKQAATQQ